MPQIQIGNKALGNVFGSDIVEIRPQGMAEIRFGGKYQYVQNPGIPVRNQKTFAFDFGQRIQMNVKGKIWDRLELGINYDTEATFAFDNKMKLDFEGGRRYHQAPGDGKHQHAAQQQFDYGCAEFIWFEGPISIWKHHGHHRVLRAAFPKPEH